MSVYWDVRVKHTFPFSEVDAGYLDAARHDDHSLEHMHSVFRLSEGCVDSQNVKVNRHIAMPHPFSNLVAEKIGAWKSKKMSVIVALGNRFRR
jgi:hypothetical protein